MTFHSNSHCHVSTAISCTSRPCTWNKGSLKRDPCIAKDRQYESFKINVKRRANFDPRPFKYQSGYPTGGKINSFLCALSYKEIPCLFQTHLSIRYEDFSYSQEDLNLFEVLRNQFFLSLTDFMTQLMPSPDYIGPFEVPGTRGQSISELWHFIRSISCSASVSRRISHMKDARSYIAFLRSHLWKIDTVSTKAMKYGLDHEDEARQAYITKKVSQGTIVEVEVPGLHMHTELPGLVCSLDGIAHVQNQRPKVYESKCPRKYKNIDPNKFDDKLSQKHLKKQTCCLFRRDDGSIDLKRNHLYYDQVQMQMGMLGMEECDFFVWSPHGSVCIPIAFNKERWEALRDDLLIFHWEVLIPEYFAMRTPRRLTPIQLE